MRVIQPSDEHSGEPTRFASTVFHPRVELASALLAGALLLAGVLFGKQNVAGIAMVWASLAIGLFYGGRAAIASLQKFIFDIDGLMVAAAMLSAWIGHPEEGALLLFLFVLSGALEDLAMRRTEREVKALHKLMPTDALVMRDGAWREVPAESLVPGDQVKIRPGERVPADSVVTSGETAIDQSAITGESLPRHVVPRDELYAGTINTDDVIEARVLRSVKESSLQKILDLVTTARSQREPVQRTIDRLNRPYALAVLFASIALMLTWRWVLERDWEESMRTAVTLLIVASPCALVIATPTATLAAIARAARSGVLFKGGQSIDRLASLGAVCFDKTGTLTIGRPRLNEVHPVAWSNGEELLAVAAGLEADSTHPIATAIREAAASKGIPPARIDAVDHTAGRGLEGSYQGRTVRLGSFHHAHDTIPVCFRNRVKEVLSKIQEQGHIGVVVAMLPGDSASDESGQAAVLIMADAVRPGAASLVNELHALGVRPVKMLTGDNSLTASRVAASLELDAFHAELLPGDKVRLVHALREDLARDPSRDRARRSVGVIGDGVNDAPALAAADVSVAIGAIGTAAALESADIVLLSDNLGEIPWALRLARRARFTVKTNLVFALTVILLMSAATVVGAAIHRPVPLSIGVLAHEGGTLLVVLNSLVLLGFPRLSSRVHADAATPADS